MTSSWLQRMLRMEWEQTTRRDGRKQMTCWCPGYKFPHRIGGGNCDYHMEQDKCPACADGYCEFHQVSDYQELDVSLTTAERNPSLTRR